MGAIAIDIEDCSNDIHVPNDTICISMQTYRKLIDDSVQLIKANKKIDSLALKIRNKDKLIEELKKPAKTQLTPVSWKVYNMNSTAQMLNTLIIHFPATYRIKMY